MQLQRRIQRGGKGNKTNKRETKQKNSNKIKRDRKGEITKK